MRQLLRQQQPPFPAFSGLLRSAGRGFVLATVSVCVTLPQHPFDDPVSMSWAGVSERLSI